MHVVLVSLTLRRLGCRVAAHSCLPHMFRIGILPMLQTLFPSILQEQESRRIRRAAASKLKEKKPAKQKLSDSSHAANHKQACKSYTNAKADPHLLGCPQHGFSWCQDGITALHRED